MYHRHDKIFYTPHFQTKRKIYILRYWILKSMVLIREKQNRETPNPTLKKLLAL